MFADIALGSETWLSPDIADNELSLFKDVIIFRKDRVGARGGGVIAAVKSNLCARAIDTKSNIEILWISL